VSLPGESSSAPGAEHSMARAYRVAWKLVRPPALRRAFAYSRIARAMLLLWTAGVLAVVASLISVAYVRRWTWTGFVASTPIDEASGDRRTKTLWDWMQLLIIPLALAALAFALNAAQSDRDQRHEEERARRERAIAAERAREDTLRVYLQQMSELLVQRGLLQPGTDSEIPTVARTLTLTTLRRLDGRRKGFVLQFLGEAGLIRRPEPRVMLSGADLRGTIMRNTGVTTASLEGANLQDADFRHSDLAGTDFRFADLRGADVRNASLWKPPPLGRSNFAFADLRNADFRYTEAGRIQFINACLTGARFAAAYLEKADFSGARGYDVDFSRSTLDGARFRDASLAGVSVDGASVMGAAFPDGWRLHGLALSRDDRRVACPPLDRR
jgi:uncharacterized protein YjbI with pentapeptide repeats